MTSARQNAGDDGLFPAERSYRAGIRRSNPDINPANIDTVAVGDESGKLSLVSAENGNELWVFDAGGTFAAGATAKDDVIYIGNEDNNLYAVNLEDGSQKWTYNAGSRFGGSPCIVDGAVLCNSVNDSFALNKPNGTKQWEFSGGGFESPTAGDGSVFFPNDNLASYAISDGSQNWSFSSGSSTPTVYEGSVYASSGDTMYSFSPDTGTQEWKNEYDTDGEGFIGAPVVVDDSIYIGYADTTRSYVYKLDASDGSKEWDHIISTGFFMDDYVSVHDDKAIFNNSDAIVALNVSDGSQAWKTNINDGDGTGGTAFDGVFYTALKDVELLVALQIDDGSEKWRYSLSDDPVSPTYIRNGSSAGTRNEQKALGHN